MPRQPGRGKKLILDDLFRQVPAPRSPSPPATLDDVLCYSQGVVAGLLKRLERCRPGEVEAACKAIQWAWRDFGRIVGSLGREKTLSAIASLVATLSPREFNQAKKVSPLVLLFEAAILERHLRRLRGREDRAGWLATQEEMSKAKANQLAGLSAGDLIEEILAHRHQVSQSEIRKRLAKSSSELGEFRRHPVDFSSPHFYGCELLRELEAEVRASVTKQAAASEKTSTRSHK